MNTHSINYGTLDRTAHEKWPVSRWIKIVFWLYFLQAVLLFLSSFIIFTVKRTQGVDPMLISGSFTGTTQLTFFVIINLAAAMYAVAGYYLYRYKSDHVEPDDPAEHLRLYFKTLAITSLPLFSLLIAGILFYVFN
ncbi:MAG TPA: hypothetical protein PKE39_00590 [Ignavibacteria bacterium]|nr:hypothetical protein [Ignavibacteria bacterium]HMQ97492.1 hypothetical protein [Ignavibacteria bacterium]